MTHVLQILPHSPTAKCGVGDYGLLLAQELKNKHDVQSSFLVAGTTWLAPAGEVGFSVRRLTANTSQALLHDVRDVGPMDTVLLHLSLYGYQKRGVPIWLSRAVRKLKESQTAPALLLMAHELAASGPPYTSSFWLRPLQEWILRELVRCADAIVTNRERYAEWLNTVQKPAVKAVTVLPVFSNLGEIASPEEEDNRWRRMLVFASTVTKQQIPLIAELVASLHTSQLTWVGTPEPPSMPPGVVIRHVPFLPSAEADVCFQAHGVAFTGYNPDYLAKSGLFAAFASHRMAVILPDAPAELPDGLRRGQHFLAMTMLPEFHHLFEEIQKVATGLHNWYKRHDLKNTAAWYAAEIFRLSWQRAMTVEQ